MPDLMFPFWMVNQRSGPATSGPPDTMAVFSTAHLATTFMLVRGDSAFEFRLVSRASFPRLAGEWKRAGIRRMCVDPGVEDVEVFDLAETLSRVTQAPEG